MEPTAGHPGGGGVGKGRTVTTVLERCRHMNGETVGGGGNAPGSSCCSDPPRSPPRCSGILTSAYGEQDVYGCLKVTFSQFMFL